MEWFRHTLNNCQKFSICQLYASLQFEWEWWCIVSIGNMVSLKNSASLDIQYGWTWQLKSPHMVFGAVSKWQYTAENGSFLPSDLGITWNPIQIPWIKQRKFQIPPVTFWKSANCLVHTSSSWLCCFCWSVWYNGRFLFFVAA